MRLALAEADKRMLDGTDGPALQLAMRIIVRLAESAGAHRLIDITSAHIDSCLYHGDAGLDFAERLAAEGGKVRVPSTLNVASLDLLHPELFSGDDHLAERGRRLMDAYVAMGCRPTWTCAPYQLPDRPGFGEHVAWAESNAIVFANSVLGARTDRYGDFIDICAGLTGRVPEAGLHLDENRRADLVVDVSGLSAQLLESDILYPVLGHALGKAAGTSVPAIVGLTDVTEDQLKALGAAAASSGGVGMFHAVGVTPEAPDLETATASSRYRELAIDAAMLRAARDDLTTSVDRPLIAVSVGTPHASLAELKNLVDLLDHRQVSPTVSVYVNTGRDVLGQAAEVGIDSDLRDSGVQIVTDTCTYITPILDNTDGLVMTDSAKWAYYAPGNLGVDVAFGSLEDCVETAVAGRVIRDESLWA